MTIKLDRERKIRFDTAALIKIEEQLDCSIFDVMKKGIRLGAIVVIVWAGLEDDLDLEYVKENLPLKRMPEIMEQVSHELAIAIGADMDEYDKEIAKVKGGDVKKKETPTKVSESGLKT